MNIVERVMRRKQVQAFIDADASSIVFRRFEKVRSSGTWTTREVVPALQAQTIRIVPSKRRYAPPYVNTEAGEIPVYPYIIIGRYNLDIKVGDRFTWNGAEWAVKSIEEDREERTVAAVDYYGGE